MGKRVSKIKLFGTWFDLNPAEHASGSEVYGKGNDEKYGHLKLVDDSNGYNDESYNSYDQDAGVAATPKFVTDVMNFSRSATNITGGPENQLWAGDAQGHIIGISRSSAIDETSPSQDNVPTDAAVAAYVADHSGGGGGSNVSITYDSGTKTLVIVTTASE